MRKIHAAAVAVNQTPIAWDENVSNIISAIHEAKQRGIQLLLFPELAITGYGCEDLFLSPFVIDTALERLSEIAEHCSDIIVAVGTPFAFRNGVYNGAALIHNTRILGITGKQHLANGNVHYESRWFQPWPKGEKGEILIAGTNVPVGDLYFTIDDVSFGFEICEDAWVSSRPGRELAKNDIDIILNPSASHFSFQKNEIRRQFVVEGSRAFSCAYLYANLLGNEAGRIIYDGASLIANDGKLVVESERFSYQSYVITSSVIDLALNRVRRREKRTGGIQQDSIVNQVISSDPIAVCRDKMHLATLPKTLTKNEEFMSAVSLGLFDYMRKSRSKGYVLSLSGGADSSAIATLIWNMIYTARLQLGNNFGNKLSYISDFTQTPSESVCSHLLTCVYQATSNSSEITLNAAKTVANAIGAKFIEWNIDQLVHSYTGLAEAAIQRKTEWSTDDLALQNIQARVRAPGVWMIANITGALLVSTSNRSEAAVGYATMDGDTSGGLAPIAGIDKSYLRSWLRWVEESGILPELSVVNVQAPTAELRPSESGQTDEEDLMPYTILNLIEQLAFYHRKSLKDIVEIVQESYPDIELPQITKWVTRFFTLWSRNQWKRERYAPSFHLDDTNNDPRSYMRFPILSGGFVKEMSELNY